MTWRMSQLAEGSFRENSSRNFPEIFLPFFLFFLRPTLDRRFDDVRREIDFVSEFL